jgi:hypothetical protein
MRYKLTVFKAPEPPRQLQVQLLDKNGFKLLQFDASDFQKLPGTTSLLESRQDFPCSEIDYRQATDYSVK